MNNEIRTIRMDVGTTSLRDVERALGAVQAKVIHKSSTPGAVGYTTIIIAVGGLIANA